MIPDFLKRENRKEPTEFDRELDEALERYEKHFGEGLSTEPLVLLPEEWIDFINLCIEENKNQWEIYGEGYDPDADY